MAIERSEPNNDEYPPRLYAPGKSPFLKRSISHHSHLSDLVELQDAIGPNVFNDIMNNSQVGVMLKLAVGKYNWCGKVVHYFITHQLAVSKPYEFWSLIAGRPVRFSLYEFEAITGLNCDPIDPDDSFEGDHTELWGQLNVKPYQGPSWQEIHDVLDKCRQWDDGGDGGDVEGGVHGGDDEGGDGGDDEGGDGGGDDGDDEGGDGGDDEGGDGGEDAEEEDLGEEDSYSEDDEDDHGDEDDDGDGGDEGDGGDGGDGGDDHQKELTLSAIFRRCVE